MSYSLYLYFSVSLSLYLYPYLYLCLPLLHSGGCGSAETVILQCHPYWKFLICNGGTTQHIHLAQIGKKTVSLLRSGRVGAEAWQGKLTAFDPLHQVWWSQTEIPSESRCGAVEKLWLIGEYFLHLTCYSASSDYCHEGMQTLCCESIQFVKGKKYKQLKKIVLTFREMIWTLSCNLPSFKC